MERTIAKRAIGIGMIAFFLFSFLSVGGAGARAADPGMGQRRVTEQGMRPVTRMESRRRIPPRVNIMRMLHRWEKYLIAQKDRLELKWDQLDQIGSILEAHRKYLIKTGADASLLRLDIRELLVKEKINIGGVEEKVKALDGLAANRIMESVRTFEKILAVLTPEQRKEANAFFKESLLRW